MAGIYTSKLPQSLLAHELDRSRRHAYTVVLVYLTLPDWQEFAALYGSTVWEEVVVSLACAAQVALRGYDYASRVNQHEFALLLPQSKTQGAHMVIRRIAEQFEGALKRVVPDVEVPLEFETATFPFDGEELSNLFATATAHRMCFTDNTQKCPDGLAECHVMLLPRLAGTACGIAKHSQHFIMD